MNSIENIKSFIISLPQCQDKYDRSSRHLIQHGIFPSKAEAVYGKNLGDDYIKNITYPSVQYTMKKGRSIDSDIFSHGAIGCYLSHVQLWKQLSESFDDTFIIFEDDIEPDSLNISNLNSFIQKISTIDPQWDIIYLGWLKPLPFLKDSDIHLDDNTYKINDITFGTHSYIIRKKGAIKLLTNAFPIVDQVDSYISYMICRGDINAYRPKTPFFKQSILGLLGGTSVQENVFVNIKPIVNRFSNRTFIITVLLLITIMLILVYKIYIYFRR